MTGGNKSRFIADVGNVGTGKAGSEFGKILQIDILAEFQFADVDGKDFLTFSKATL